MRSKATTIVVLDTMNTGKVAQLNNSLTSQLQIHCMPGGVFKQTQQSTLLIGYMYFKVSTDVGRLSVDDVKASSKMTTK